MINTITYGDCLDIMKYLPDKSIDMILCDLPYGVTNRNLWDNIIPYHLLWEAYERIIKPNGAIVLYAIQPFASTLICSNIKWFKYEWIWQKNVPVGFLNAKKQPLRNHEHIIVFYKSQSVYNPQFTTGKPYKTTKGDHGTNYGGRGKYATVRYTINEGTRYPVTVLSYPKDKEKYHPTQKPVGLCEYLIKTYTHENDVVLDNCAGSGSILVAAKKCGRQYIGIEKEKHYYDICIKRLNGELE